MSFGSLPDFTNTLHSFAVFNPKECANSFASVKFRYFILYVAIEFWCQQKPDTYTPRDTQDVHTLKHLYSPYFSLADFFSFTAR